MIGRISQLKQTISDELQQAAAPKPNDPVAVIERHSRLLKADSPNVDDVISELESVNGNEEGSPANPVSNGSEGVSVDPSNSTSAQNSGAAKDQTALQGQDSSAKLEPEPKSRSKSPPLSATPSRSESEEPSASDATALQTKLTKLAKYEEKYPQLLKAYKIEKKRYELVKLYEKVLSEHTPCSSVAEPQMLVNYLQELNTKSEMQQKELQKLQSELNGAQQQTQQLKASLNSVKAELSTAHTELSKLQNELQELRKQQAAEQAASKTSSADSKREDELKHKVEMLENQLGGAEQARSSAAKSQASIKSQYDELNARFRENLAEMDVLRDELLGAERQVQDKLHELSSLKSQIHHREKGRRLSADVNATELAKAISEKEQLEADLELLNKRVLRDSDQLNLQIKSLKSQLQESESHEARLRHQLAQVQSASNGSRSGGETPISPSASTQRLRSHSLHIDELQSAAPAANESTQVAEAKEAAASMTKANELLKQVNADNALRIEKLQKSQRALALDMEQLRHENMLLKKGQSRRGSVSSVASSSRVGGGHDDAESLKQQAYIKNVLLGFVEHKDQRKALLPVIATLLGLKDSETEQFFKGFA